MPSLRFWLGGDSRTRKALQRRLDEAGYSEGQDEERPPDASAVLRQLREGEVACLLDEHSVDLSPGVLRRWCSEPVQARILTPRPLVEFPELRAFLALVPWNARWRDARWSGAEPGSRPIGPPDAVVSRAFDRADRSDLLGSFFTSRRFFPSTIFLEATTACNLRCPMCPCHGEGRAVDLVGAFMDLALYERILDEAARHDEPPGTMTINPQLRGESTLHPRFATMLEMAHARSLRVSLSTNAVLLARRPDLVEAVSRWADYVFVSLDAVRPETYRAIRGGDLSEVTGGIDRLLEERARLGGPGPQVYAAFVDMDCNHAELESFLECWRARADGALVYQERLSPGWYRNARPAPDRLPCPHVVRSCAITVEGTLTPCCFAAAPTERLGSLAEGASLEELYNAAEYARFRALHAAHDFAGSHLCADCNAWGAYRFADGQPPGWHVLDNAYSRFYVADHSLPGSGSVESEP